VSAFLFDAVGVPEFFRGHPRIPRPIPTRRPNPTPALRLCLTALSCFVIRHFAWLPALLTG
jgi:hypothetical protein